MFIQRKLITVSAFAIIAATFSGNQAAMAQDEQDAAKPEIVKAVDNTVDSKEKRNWLKASYEARNMQPLWVNRGGPKKRLKKYLDALAKAEEIGLDPDDYGYTALKKAADDFNRRERHRLDVMASRSFVNYAMDLRDGRVSPRFTFTDEELAGREASKSALLKEISETDDPGEFLEDLRTENPVERNLHIALNRYLNLAKETSWEPIKMSADKLEIGATGPTVQKIAERLRIEGFFDGDVAMRDPSSSDNENMEANKAEQTKTAYYDERLAKAVSDFQTSRGIVEDGIVGPNTLEAMNMPVEALIDKLKLNIERARWLPQEFADRYAMVNIARFTVGLYEDDKLEREIKTVVGKYHQQTPVFAGSMSYVVVNPYWNVPASILRDEIAPKMLEDSNYLKNNDMEVVRGWDDDTAEIVNPKKVNWKAVVSGEETELRVRQRPGPKNALGRIKFMFPNQYAVYLHDTPAQSLFNRTDRAFSHGCIRLDEPVAFAEWVFKGKPGLDKNAIEEKIQSSNRDILKLDEEIPVYIAYFTAWADDDGRVYFLDDIYDRDEGLAQALKNAKPVLEISGDDFLTG